jgi:arylsulfatase
MKKHRLFLECLLIGMAGSAISFGAEQAAEEPVRPNIILVMTDDQGYGDLGCHGHPFLKTPNLDRLYDQSMRFTDFHVSPTCAPTRGALMSGKLSFKVGITHTILERERMALSATTVAEVLRGAGYTTGIFGKWHLGDADPYQPENRGFDEVFIHGAGGIGQNYPGTQGAVPGTGYFNPIIKHNGIFEQTEGYCTDVFFRQALGWIKANKEKTPFFAYLAPNAPHGPFIVADSYKAPFNERVEDEKTASFLGMIVNIDENMGLLMQKLEEWELANNTLLIFMTDNGSSKGWKVYNAGMRAGKGSAHQGGARVPLFMRLPGLTTPGVDIGTLTRHVDLFPTLAELAGVPLSDDLDLDGRSLLRLIRDPQAEWPSRQMIFHCGRWGKAGAPGKWGEGNTSPDGAKFRNFAVRTEKWRLVGSGGADRASARVELYAIEKDPGESTNVFNQFPEVADQLIQNYEAWWNDVRPLMINEDASLDTGKPFIEQFERQQETSGIPKWNAPEL